MSKWERDAEIGNPYDEIVQLEMEEDFLEMRGMTKEEYLMSQAEDRFAFEDL